jgi:enoyl-CoA hydratase/carnithine racemase
MELVLSGRRMDAAQAQRLGIVNRVTKADEWLAGALEVRTAAQRLHAAGRLDGLAPCQLVVEAAPERLEL